MKKMGLAVLALGLIATAASAEVTSVNLHQIPGTYGTPSVDTVNGVSSVAIESLDDGRIPYQLGTEGYDNWPSVLGGAGSPSVCVGTSCTVGTWAYFRWTNTDLQWGDDIHGYIGSSMDHLHYQFLALGATAPRTVQHTIQIYDMFPPSASHGTAIGVVTMGMMYTSMHVTYTYTNTLNAAFAATVAFTPVVLNSDSMWVSFRETGSNTYWLTGGRPTIAPN
ncbi:MAG: hypothetical protein GY778_27605, partial [bacterium]|nr:hypothetical protein [bacterium]